jgi:uncharacterized protein
MEAISGNLVYSWGMRLFACGLALAVSGTVGAQAPTPLGPPSVSTSGTAEATVAPDRATIHVAVQTQASTAAAAAAENAKITRAVLDTLRALGLSKDQTGTLGYSVLPQYSYDKGKAHLTGYEAQNTVKVEVKVLTEVGRLVDGALGAGANNISSLQFTATNQDSARRDALRRATEQARGDAEALAGAVNATLGPPLELTTEVPERRFFPQPVFRLQAAEAAAAPTPIDAGPITISVTVHGRWPLVSAGR